MNKTRTRALAPLGLLVGAMLITTPQLQAEEETGGQISNSCLLYTSDAADDTQFV